MSDECDEQDPPLPTWASVDLSAYLDGTHTPEVPTLMPRTDGHCLLYAGRVHSFHGETETFKSGVSQAVACRLILEGRDVCYLDFESDAGTVVGRLLEMGATPESISAHFDYRRPGVRPAIDVQELVAFEELLTRQYALVVIDGVTEALHIFGTATNDELTGWMRAVPRHIATSTGAAVVLVDHVTKNAESRGRFAIGGQAKMAALDGAAYVVEIMEPLGRGMRGVVSLRVAKDRPGSVRAYAGTFRKTDRTQEAAHVVVDSRTPGRINVLVGPPTAADGGEDRHTAFRPTTLMHRLSEAMQTTHEPMSTNKLLSRVTGKRATLQTAIDVLVAENYVERLDGPNRAKLLTLVRPYVPSSDPASDSFDSQREPLSQEDEAPGGDLGGSLVPGLKNRTGEPPHNPSQVSPGNHRGTTGEPPALLVVCPLCGASFPRTGRGICPSCDQRTRQGA